MASILNDVNVVEKVLKLVYLMKNQYTLGLSVSSCITKQLSTVLNFFAPYIILDFARKDVYFRYLCLRFHRSIAVEEIIPVPVARTFLPDEKFVILFVLGTHSVGTLMLFSYDVVDKCRDSTQHCEQMSTLYIDIYRNVSQLNFEKEKIVLGIDPFVYGLDLFINVRGRTLTEKIMECIVNEYGDGSFEKFVENIVEGVKNVGNYVKLYSRLFLENFENVGDPWEEFDKIFGVDVLRLNHLINVKSSSEVEIVVEKDYRYTIPMFLLLDENMLMQLMKFAVAEYKTLLILEKLVDK